MDVPTALNKPKTKRALRDGEKRARVRTRNALYEQIVRSAKDAVIGVDDRQNIVLSNPAAEIIFCCDGKTVIGQSLAQFIPPSARLAHHRYLADCSERHDPVRVRVTDDGRGCKS